MLFQKKPTSPMSSELAPKKDRVDTFVGTTAKPIGPPAKEHEEGVVVVGKGTRIHGSISDCRILDVHGVVEADVIAETLIVRDSGGIRGTVEVDNAEIRGVVEGSLTVYEHLEVAATGNISGQSSFQTLAVATGATLAGTVVTSEQVDQKVEQSKIPDKMYEPATDKIGQEQFCAINGTAVKTSAGDISVAKNYSTGNLAVGRRS